MEIQLLKDYNEKKNLKNSQGFGYDFEGKPKILFTENYENALEIIKNTLNLSQFDCKFKHRS